jgi:biotin synthase
VSRALIDLAATALLDDRRPLTGPELAALADIDAAAVPSLAALAHEVRVAWCGAEVELEGILSAKTGGCPEDCHFCSQSARFDSPVKATPFLDIDELLAAARETEAIGASEFCIVLAVRGPDLRVMDQILRAVEAVRSATSLNVAVSAGILTARQARALASAGVHRYNHNLETARSYFPSVVTTHDFDERWATCEMVREAGMELCCGGIVGMGETAAQRAEFAAQLAELDPDEVPLNFLNPRPGTPFGELAPMSGIDALRAVATFRLTMPRTILRFAGGREITLGDLAERGVRGGINAVIVGNYLTTLGRPADQDLAMLADLKMPIKALARNL